MDIKNRKSISQSASYFDDYQRGNYWNETAKNYQSVLFKGGKPLQSRELNLLQSILHNRLKTMGDSLYKNGSVVNGCAVTYNDNSDSKILSITDGIIYWDGTFFEITASTKTLNEQINSFNLLYVYLYPKYEIVKPEDDSELRDPSIYYRIGEGVDGADRLKVTFEIIESVDNEKEYYKDNGKKSALPVQRFLIAVIDKNGEVTLSNRNFKLDEIDINGITEVVEGLKIRNNKTYYEIESGNGTINGDEVVFDGYERIDIDDLRNKHNIVIDNNSLMDNAEVKLLDVRDNPLSGSIWCDVPFQIYSDNNSNIQLDNSAYFDGMLLPGQEIEIYAKIKDESDMVLLGTAEIAESYILGSNQLAEETDVEEPPIEVIPIPPQQSIIGGGINIDLIGSATSQIIDPILLDLIDYDTTVAGNNRGNWGGRN